MNSIRIHLLFYRYFVFYAFCYPKSYPVSCLSDNRLKRGLPYRLRE
ncbi:hypothetical protein C8R31_101394 [Nitrosospira sp. Nsp2]|nr:hypothetical protein C8R31_101394 [Nitrosospira sp. Nsp2]